MATDLADYSNLRLLIKQTSVPTSLRNGVMTAGNSWIIDCYAKGEMLDAADLYSVSPRSQILKGYITRWVQLPSGVNWILGGSGLQWNTTGLAPSGLMPGATGEGFLGQLDTTLGIKGTSTILSLADPYGFGGIGAELREEIGDSIRIQLQIVG